MHSVFLFPYLNNTKMLRIRSFNRVSNNRTYRGLKGRPEEQIQFASVEYYGVFYFTNLVFKPTNKYTLFWNNP